jgi:cytosine permease
VSWIVGFLVGYFYHAGLPSLNALIASGIVYYVGMLVYSVVAVSKKEEASILE